MNLCLWRGVISSCHPATALKSCGGQRVVWVLEQNPHLGSGFKYVVWKKSWDLCRAPVRLFINTSVCLDERTGIRGGMPDLFPATMSSLGQIHVTESMQSHFLPSPLFVRRRVNILTHNTCGLYTCWRSFLVLYCTYVHVRILVCVFWHHALPPCIRSHGALLKTAHILLQQKGKLTR